MSTVLRLYDPSIGSRALSASTRSMCIGSLLEPVRRLVRLSQGRLEVALREIPLPAGPRRNGVERTDPDTRFDSHVSQDRTA